MGLLLFITDFIKLRLIMRQVPEQLARPDIEWLVGDLGRRIRRCESADPQWLARLATALSTRQADDRGAIERQIASVGIACCKSGTAIAVLNALSRLAAKNEASINFIMDCLKCKGGPLWDSDGSVRKSAQAILPCYSESRRLLDRLIDRELGLDALEALPCIGLIGPGTYWPVWDYVIHYFLLDPGNYQEAAAAVVFRHRIPLDTVRSWLGAIPTDRFAANISPEVAKKIFGLCEILAFQYADSIEAADTVITLIERLRSVPRECGSVLWVDLRAVMRLGSILKRFSKPIAEMALLRVIRLNRHLLLEGEGSPNPWGIFGRFMGGDNPQDAFCNAVDDLSNLAGRRAEDLLIRAAGECGGTVRPETIEHVREKLRSI